MIVGRTRAAPVAPACFKNRRREQLCAFMGYSIA